MRRRLFQFHRHASFRPVRMTREFEGEYRFIKGWRNWVRPGVGLWGEIKRSPAPMRRMLGQGSDARSPVFEGARRYAE